MSVSSFAAARTLPTVLLVEDETMIRIVLADAFEDAGFGVIEAASAGEAIEHLATHDGIALVITDVRMPGALSGLDLAAWVRKHRPGLKIIVMSGYVHEEVVNSGQAYDALVHKPFTPRHVIEQSRALLKG